MSYLVDTESINPCFNLAAEEYLFRRFSDEIVFLYINSPSVIIGKHQNAYEEINLKYIITNNIPVIRRISGGGSVFHDLGNLNFTFIGNKREGSQINFAEQTRPIIAFLEEKGLKPWLGDKNEIRVGDWKFSGNAEHIFKSRVLHHGTLLFSSQLSQLGEALRRGDGVYHSRAVKSNRTNVGNLAPHLKDINDIMEFKDELGAMIMLSRPDISVYKLSQEDRLEVNKLVQEKYSKDIWNFSYGPDYSFKNTFLFDGSSIELAMEIKKGRITDIKVSGNSELEKAANKLIDTEHLYKTIKDVLISAMPEANDKLAMHFFR